MTHPVLPSGGGSYERLKDGTLRVIEQPLATHDTTTDPVPAEVAPDLVKDPAAAAAPKPARRADLKET